MYRSMAREIKEIDDEPIPEERGVQQDVRTVPRRSGLESIKAQAREKSNRDVQDEGGVQRLLDDFKKVLGKEKRTQMIGLCEREDMGRVGYVSIMAFSRVLKNIGFRLLFDQVKTLITTLRVYDELKDKVFYIKVISSAFRKLFKRDPYKVPPKPTKMDAITLIQKFIKNKREARARAQKAKVSKNTVSSKDIISGLAQKIQKSGKPLLRTFEEIDTDYSGFIELPEFNALLQGYGVDLSKDQLLAVFKLIDTDNIDKINYRSLLKAVETYTNTTSDVLGAITITREEKEKAIADIVKSMKTLFKGTKMTPEQMFKYFDKEGRGSIDCDTFINVITKITGVYTQFQIKQVFQYIDTSNDGLINYREFGRVFFDVVESPAEILKRKELEERKRFEEEIKKKWQEEDALKRNPVPPAQVVLGNSPNDEKIPERKPTIQEEIKRKQQEAEEQQRKEDLKKLDPMLAQLEELKKKEKLEQEKKKKELEEKKKKEQAEKQAKSAIGKVFQNIGKTKPVEEKKIVPKRSGSAVNSNRTQGKKSLPIKRNPNEKSSKLLHQSSENLLSSRVFSKDLLDMVRKEFIYPLISRVATQGDSILQARHDQHLFENRPVTRHVYKWGKDWGQEVLNPMPRTIWVSADIGRVGFLDDQGYLNQLDLISGTAFPVLHLGTKPPFQRTPLLAAACDSKTGRLYLLNKQWVLEVWELHQQTTAPRKRIKVLSKIIGDDYVEKFYKNRYREVHPKLLSLSESGEIIVNATCVDGFLYCFEPISLTLLWRLRLSLKELQIPEPIMKAFEEFSYFIRECNKLGISEQRVFELLDRNGDGKLSFEEFCQAVRENKMPLTEAQIKAMFKTMDADLSGSISIDEFWGGVYMRNQEVLQREISEKGLIHLPDWVANVTANDRAKDCMYKLHRVIENRGLSHHQVFLSIDTDGSGYITRGEFSRGLLGLLSPLISASDIELLLQIADRDNSGSINSREFLEFLSMKKLAPEDLSQLNSSALPRDSIQYVIHKCIELGVDLYQMCKLYDKGGSGTLPKEIMSSLLLWLPIGLTAGRLNTIIERDLMYSANGQVDYQEIFERENYLELLKNSNRKVGVEMIVPQTQEEAAVVEDYEYLETLGIVAFSTNNPVSSIIYLKHIEGNMIARLIGHFGDQPPVLHYISSANVLVSGERRDPTPPPSSFIGPSLPPCELLLWNLQNDLIDKFQSNPPWTVRPYKKVYAHSGSLVDIAYLPVTQLLVTTASDGLIKLWTPTGTPYSLTDPHHLHLQRPGPCTPPLSQHTSANSVLACVGQISRRETACYRLVTGVLENCEWLVCLQIGHGSSKSVSGCVESWGFKRMNLSVPARQHDWEVPGKIMEGMAEVFERHRGKMIGEYRGGLANRLEKIVNNCKVAKAFEKEIKVAVVRSVIFEVNYENVLKMIVVLPDRMKKGKVCCEELYNYLVAYAGFGSISFTEFLYLLDAITERIGSEPPPKKRTELGLATILKMIEDKKNVSQPVAPAKSNPSVIASIQNSKKQQEALFETPIKGIEQELFEYLCARLMEKKISVAQLFESIDTDQSGLISLDEFTVFLQQLGYTLQKSEAKSIMKCIDYNSDDTISYKELLIKLKAYGYKEQWQPASYSHTWSDSSLLRFFKNFTKKSQFRNVLEFLQYFDYNKDGILTSFELRSALNSIDKAFTDRIVNILLVATRNSLSIPDLARAITRIEFELPKPARPPIQYPAMQDCIARHNSLALLRNCVEELSIYCLSMTALPRRGVELLARQYRTREGLQLLGSAIIRFQELIDSLFSNSLSRIYKESFKGLIPLEHNVQMNTFTLDIIHPKRLEADDFKVLWEAGNAISGEISEYSGNLLPELDEITVAVYSPAVLKHISSDGSTLYTHLTKELALHTSIQERSADIIKCLGYHEKHVGLDKSIFALYRKTPGFSVESLVKDNGGLLKIPILCNTKASLYLFKYWGRRVLAIISALHSHSMSLRCLVPGSLHLSNDGCDITLTSLKGVGQMDAAGGIQSAPDIDLYFQDDIKQNAFVAPEFYFNASQSALVDTWSFGAIMYYLMLGRSPTSFLEKYRSWNEEKFVKTQLGELGVGGNLAPAPSFPYNVFEGYEVVNGRACSGGELGVIRSLKNTSFTGIVRDTPQKSEIEEIEEMYKGLQELKNTKSAASSDIGKALDVISLCLQLNPRQRPTIKALMNSPVFTLDKYEETQARIFAGLIFQHKNPEIIITEHISIPLSRIKSEELSADHSEEIINIIERLGDSLLNFEDSIGRSTSKAVSAMTLPAKEKDLILKKNLNSPITELANQAIKDEVFSTLCYLALNIYSQGDNSVLLSYANLLKYLLFHLNSEDSGLSALVSVLIEVLLKLFVGEDQCLASKAQVPGYVLKRSLWNPELYEIMAPVYRQSISESGFGQHDCPVIKEHLGKVRHADYYSELLMLAENFNLLKTPESSAISKRSALRHIKSMLQTKNSFKIIAALDFKLPQLVIHCVQDSDYQVRAEALEIFFQISEGCVEPLLPKLPGVNKDYRSLGVINFFSNVKKQANEATRNFEKFSTINDSIPQAVKDLAVCFESPMFVFPVVRLIKFKTEAFDAKEIAVRILVNALKGSEKCQLACLSPITDTVATLCKCLVVSSRTVDKKSARSMGPLMKNLLGNLLENARSYILAAFKNTPGAEALLREQALAVPEKMTLPVLYAMKPAGVALDSRIQVFVQGLKNWLMHERSNSSGNPKEQSVITESFDFLKNSVGAYWDIADVKQEGEGILAQAKIAKEKVRAILMFFEWALFSELDLGWFKSETNVQWLISTTSKGILSSRSDLEVFALEEETLICQRILCRVLGKDKDKPNILLGKLKFGIVFAEHLEMQYSRLVRVISRYTEPLHVLKYYSTNSEIRLATFCNLLQFTNLQGQFLESGFMEVLVRDFLTDYQVLTARFNKLSLEFLPFRNTPPVRAEAINLIIIILKEKIKCKVVYDDMILQLQRHATVQNEVMNSMSSNATIQATAMELLQAFISSEDQQLECLLMQCNAKDTFRNIIQAEPEIRMRFPVISNYSK